MSTSEENSASETVTVHVASTDVAAIGAYLNRANIVWRTFTVSRSGIAGIEILRTDAPTLNAALDGLPHVTQREFSSYEAMQGDIVEGSK